MKIDQFGQKLNLSHLHTLHNWLTPWSWVVLEKPPVAQLLSFTTIYGTQWFSPCSQEPTAGLWQPDKFCQYHPILFLSDPAVLMSRDSAFGIATGYGLDDRGSEFESRQGQEFFLRRIVQTGFGVYPTCYPLDTGAFSLGIKWQRCEADNSPPTRR
jgi:hypothetical protein